MQLLRSFLSIVLFSFLCLQAIIAQEYTEDFEAGNLVEAAIDGIGTCIIVNEISGNISLVRSIGAADGPVRAGWTSFIHQTPAITGSMPNHKRAEVDIHSWNKHPKKEGTAPFTTETGGDRYFYYWYGWSYYFPSDSFDDKERSCVGQFRFSNLYAFDNPVRSCTTTKCDGTDEDKGGVGHLFVYDKGDLEFWMGYPDTACESCLGQLQHQFTVLEELPKDVWIDFVIQAKWSHQVEGQDVGEFQLWAQVDGKGYTSLLDYEGPSWFDFYQGGFYGHDVSSPNWTIGQYWGTDHKSSTLYSDEIRMWRTFSNEVDSGFNMVRPDQICAGQAIGQACNETVAASSTLQQEKSVSLFPNPVTDSLQMMNLDHIRQIKIIGINGKILRIIENEASEQLMVDVSSLTSGVYYLQMFDEVGAKVQSEKFIKMRR